MGGGGGTQYYVHIMKAFNLGSVFSYESSVV